MNLLMCPLLGNTVFFLFLVTCDASPSYYITTSGTTIYGTNTSLAVHWFGDNYADITVTAGIMDKSRLLVNASKVFYNDLIGILTVPAIPADSSSDSYTLVVNGSAQNTLVFSEKIQLYMQKKNISMFIQTDKTMYRSGESVKIRVISVRHDLKPYKGDVDLIIRDPKDNIVQQRLKMKSDLGVVSTQFLLSNNPMLGDWYIQATSDNSVNAVYFSVAEYVTPKFYVTLDVPSFYISTKMLNLTGTVTAKYSYGKPLKGNVTISVKPSYEVEGNSEVSKTYEISGSVNFSFTHEEILNALYLGGMNVTATVTEELTGIVANASTYVSRANSEYILNLIGQQQAFTPGLNFTAKVQVGRIDNKPLTLEERDEKVYVKITQSTGPYWISRVLITDDSTPDNSLILQYYSIKESDIINLEIPVLLSVQLIQVELEYQNTTQIFYFDKSYGTYPFIQIQTSNSSLKVGTSFNLQVNTYPKVEDVYYVVMAKGTVVSAGKNKTTFSLTPEQSWAPTAQLIVYFLNINGSFGDIVQTSEIFSILGTLKNKITLSWSKNTVGPLENVSLSVNVKESRSLVELQVVEKSSGLLRNFTARRVDEELNLYYKGLLASITNAIISNTYGFNIRQIEEVNPPRQVKLIFPETWIWLETNISSSLVANLQFAVPDKNTSWVATAFVISEGLGLGITDGPAEISVVKPLFITFNMPFSLTRGEQFILEIILSNSLKENLQVMVTLESSNTFEIIVPNNNTGTVAGQQNVTVASEGAATVLFPVKPKVLGNITITVKATSKAASDVLTKTIIVKAEGVKNLYSQTALFEVLTTGNLNHMISKNFSFTFPSDVVEGSEEAFVTVIGDLLGPSINGLQSLILMPYGCGEQNMINFAPNIYILLYLTVTKQIKADIQERAISFMEQGYQTELTYMRNDGSFSAFGNSDNSGSTWLTAFVYRCFLQARPFIYINPDVLNGTVEWLVQFQDINTGIFSEPGRVIHKELQGGLNGPITLTAYILTSLLEDQYYSHRYASRVLKAVQYLEGKFDQGIASNYTLSVVVYALSLANSTRAEAALTQLNARASITGTGGTKYWSSPSETANYYWQPRTTDIETAAYALLSYYQQNRIAEGIPVMKWLSEQRNYLGGYSSTQDTVMALQALSQFVSVVPSSETSLTVTVTGPFVPKVFHINTNLLVLQSQQIEAAQPLLINVTAVGRGLAIVQLNVEYNRKASARRRRNTPVSEAFKLDMTVKENSSNIQKLSVDVCMSYLGEDKESGMVILDFGFLSGFKLSPEGIPTKEPLKLVEPKDDKVYLYFHSLTNNEVCVSVPMVRFAKVAGSQDAVVSIYEYYNQRNTATRTYNSLTMKNISYCVFCGVNCTQCKSNVPLKTQTSSVTAPTFSMLWFCMVLLCYLL